MTPLLSLAPLYDFSLIERAIQAFFCQPAAGDPAWPDVAFVTPPTEPGPGATDEQVAAWDNREIWRPGGIPIFTAYESLLFQKHRPRVAIDLNSIVEVPKTYIVDNDQVLRGRAWSARLQFAVVTAPSYVLHTQLRAVVMAMIPMLGPTMQPDGSGIARGGANQFLQYHEIATLALADNSTHIAPEEGAYVSPVNCAINFSVRATAWPEGTIHR